MVRLRGPRGGAIDRRRPARALGNAHIRGWPAMQCSGSSASNRYERDRYPEGGCRPYCFRRMHGWSANRLDVSLTAVATERQRKAEAERSLVLSSQFMRAGAQERRGDSSTSRCGSSYRLAQPATQWQVNAAIGPGQYPVVGDRASL
jgi:hypothetical protein